MAEEYKHENILHKRQFDLQFSIRFEAVDDVNFYSPYHWHNHIELLYIIEGEMDFRIEGRRFTLESDDVIIVNSEVVHSSKLYGHVRYILLQVPLSAFNGIFERPESIKVKEKPEKTESEKVASFLKNMLEYTDEQKPENQIKLLSILYDCLYYLFTDLRISGTEETMLFADSGIRRISPVITYVEKNFKEKISLPEAAEIINVTSEHLCRMFKKYTDMTFNEYLMALRLSAFYQGLMTTDQKISALLEENGITNYKVFSREFKGIFGRTPEEVRADRTAIMENGELRPIIKDGLEGLAEKMKKKKMQ